MAPDVKPLNDFVLLEEAPPKPYHAWKGYSKIIVPEAFEYGPEDRPVIGRILAKGNRCTNEAVLIGDIALIGKYDGARFPRNGKIYLVVREANILATLHE